MTYRRRWRTDTLKHCGLHGTRRSVFHALVTAADWKGRSQKPYRELAQIADVSPRSCAAALLYLTQAGFVLIRERGSSHRPAWLQVVPYEPASEPALVQSRCTEDSPSLVQSVYVATSVNYAQLVEQSAKPRAGVEINERSEHHPNGHTAHQHRP